jgi:hypothetical protein
MSVILSRLGMGGDLIGQKAYRVILVKSFEDVTWDRVSG